VALPVTTPVVFALNFFNPELGNLLLYSTGFWIHVVVLLFTVYRRTADSGLKRPLSPVTGSEGKQLYVIYTVPVISVTQNRDRPLALPVQYPY
jgi:hypothetical protein